MSRVFSRAAIAAIACCVLVATIVAAVPKDMAMYVGGTIPNLEEKAEGRLTTADTSLTFQAKFGTPVSIPYKRITSMEYGQKAGRRVGVAILVSPLALFSKKRNHYLTVTYKDTKGVEQAGVFELGKDIVRTTLTVLQVRTGKDVEYQDVEACKQFKTSKECESN